MSKPRDITNNKFGRLTAISVRCRILKGKSVRAWFCKCDCGKEKEVLQTHLTRGNTVSCGCVGATSAKTHGLNNCKLNGVWNSIKQRCYNVNNKKYYNYGGRGIKVCDEWKNSKEGFLKFYNWSMANGYKEGLSIDRIDNDGPYSPENCRWITNKQQQGNKRTNFKVKVNGKFVCLKEAVRRCAHSSLTYSCVKSRIYRRGWPVWKALRTPKM